MPMTQILSMTKAHREAVLSMMRVFYTSPAVATNGSEEIFNADIDTCVSDSPYLEGFVFSEDGVLAGYAMIAKSFSTEYGVPCIWIEDIYITPEYRGHGIASRFFSYLDEKFPGCLFRLEVEDENLPAIHTYRKNGFSEWPYKEMKKGK
ncbi:MAG: GNAT family N-acetyltransferase [Ruminococcaceae bacterium]|nr:GNAT family N-acetyltransferase [Oscillospiraceae bacterium]